MAPKKASVKTGKPAAKAVEKKEEKITAKTPAAPPTWTKVQTAEGWNRSMKKACAKKK